MKREFTGLILFGGTLIVVFILQINNFQYSRVGELQATPSTHAFTSATHAFTSAEPLITTIDPVNATSSHSFIAQQIALRNKKQDIKNWKKFGPVTNETVLITIQVHNRISYLRRLIDSLRASRDISTALLIISHDIFDKNLNEMIESIDFCMVLQIFFPYSIQTHPDSFPGTDPRDCPRDITKIVAKSHRCLNFEHPDLYGHYREAKFTQMKHHWWWKLNFIFDHLRVTRRHQGFLILLEEDYYMAKDFIHVFKLVRQWKAKNCAKCNILSLGTYSENVNGDTYNKVDVSSWVTNVHNMGMAFNRSTWNAIKRCALHFCNYDEYNYDFSLQNVNRECLKDKLVVAGITGPRVYHVGDCGIHHKTSDCNDGDKVREVKEMLSEAEIDSLLFPEALKSGISWIQDVVPDETPNGGWGDKRDQKLCLKMTIEVG